MPKLDRPDRLIFDFDPMTASPCPTSSVPAQLMRTLLGELELTPFLKTTGEGPARGRADSPDVAMAGSKAFTKSVATCW